MWIYVRIFETTSYGFNFVRTACSVKVYTNKLGGSYILINSTKLVPSSAKGILYCKLNVATCGCDQNDTSDVSTTSGKTAFTSFVRNVTTGDVILYTSQGNLHGVSDTAAINDLLILRQDFFACNGPTVPTSLQFFNLVAISVYNVSSPISHCGYIFQSPVNSISATVTGELSNILTII